MANKTRQKGVAPGLLDQVTHVLNRGGRRGARDTNGVTGKAASFVAGFLSGGDRGRKKGRGGRRRR